MCTEKHDGSAACTELVEPGGRCPRCDSEQHGERCRRCDDELTVRVYLADRHSLPDLTASELLTVAVVLATDPSQGTPKAVRDAAKRLRFPSLEGVT